MGYAGVGLWLESTRLEQVRPEMEAFNLVAPASVMACLKECGLPGVPGGEAFVVLLLEADFKDLVGVIAERIGAHVAQLSMEFG